MRSRVRKCNRSVKFAFSNCNSSFKMPTSCFAWCFITSVTVITCGILSFITSKLQEMDCSQSVNANSASSTSFEYTPRCNFISISTLSVVKSLMEAILTFPLFAAVSMDCIRVSVLLPAGSSVITIRLGSEVSNFARVMIFPNPS